MAIFTIQSEIDANAIPSALVDSIPKNKIAAELRTPNSVNAKVGIKVVAENVIPIKTMAEKNEISTSKIQSKK